MDGFSVVFDKVVDQITFPVIIEHNRHSSKLFALIDTGAMHSTIPASVARTFGLEEIGVVGARFAKGRDVLPVVRANLIFSDKVYFENKDLIVVDEEDRTYNMIIGMDILSQGDMAISNYNEHTTFTFRKPSQVEVIYSGDLVTNESIDYLMGKIEDELLST